MKYTQTHGHNEVIWCSLFIHTYAYQRLLLTETRTPAAPDLIAHPYHYYHDRHPHHYHHMEEYTKIIRQVLPQQPTLSVVVHTKA